MVRKRCTCCKEIKDLSEFYPLKRGGYRSECKSCGKAYVLNYLRKHKRPDSVVRKYERNRVCRLLYRHHEDMSGDPEHLTTEFLQSIIGINCDAD